MHFRESYVIKAEKINYFFLKQINKILNISYLIQLQKRNKALIITFTLFVIETSIFLSFKRIR